MVFKYQFDSINPLLLIPALTLAYDFLPEWFIYSSAIQLILLTFFRINKFLGYINFYFLYRIFETVGKQIIPETMIPSLATLLLAQMIYNKAIGRNESFLFFLWLGIFSVFSSSFSYLVYSLAVLTYFFLQQSSDNSLSLRAIINTFIEQKIQLLFTAIVAVLLFIFFPRFHNFLPSANHKTQGEIGYSKNVDNTNTANLQLSSKVAFYAELDQKLPIEQLYWRGRILNQTDGYNWTRGKIKPTRPIDIENKNFIKTQMKYEQDFEGDVILLDLPYQVLESNFRTYDISTTQEFRFYRKLKKASLTALSINRNNFPEHELRGASDYLELPKFIPKSVQEIDVQIKHASPQSIIQNFQKYLIENKFEYTLQPGLLPTMNEFIIKKRGYCTHFASLLGIILRLNNIPTRLVTGFQGGEYNQVGNFYIIKSNDAHTWVEYFHQKKWHRIDPTGFVSPGRINLGGTNFLNGQNTAQAKAEKQNVFLQFYNQFKLQLDNINYKVSLYFDNFNRDKQNDLSEFFKVNRKTFYWLGFIFISVIILFYLFLTRKRPAFKIHPIDKNLIILDKKIKQTRKLAEQFTIREMFSIINQSNFETQSKNEIFEILKLYQIVRYAGGQDEQKLKYLIKNLKPLKEKK